jgi:5-methylcytosine-specific restriction endonuclease McrA
MNRRHGREEIEYFHPALEDILKETYGYIVYQEAALQIAMKIANFTPVDADLLRQAIGKKDAKLMEKLHPKFVQGCVGNTAMQPAFTPQMAEELFHQIEKSSRYSFNKCISGKEFIYRACGHRKDLYKPNIQEMYKIRNDYQYAKSIGKESLCKKYRRGYGHCFSLVDGKLKKNQIVDIRYVGVHPIFRVTMECGRTIDVTDNHKFPTPLGERQLKHISVGEALYVSTFEYTQQSWWSKRGRNNIDNIPQKGQRGFQTKEISMTNNLDKFRDKYREYPCHICSNLHHRMEVHHLDGNHDNSVEENMTMICPSCHKKAHYTMGRIKQGEKGYGVYESKIISIEHVGKDDVYDVEVSGNVSHTFATSSGIITSNSHSAAYGETAYIEAWLKYHFQLSFHASKLSYVKEQAKKKEKRLLRVREYIASAKKFKITVLPPSLGVIDPYFTIDEQSHMIRFGLCAISGIGLSAFQDITDGTLKGRQQFAASYGFAKSIIEMTWYDLLLFVIPQIGQSLALTLAKVGAMDFTGTPRLRMDNEITAFLTLRPGEIEWCKQNASQHKNIASLLRALLASHGTKGSGIRVKTRLPKVQSVIEQFDQYAGITKDPSHTIIQFEEELLGLALTTTELVDYDSSQSNATVRDISGPPKREAMIACQIRRIKEHVIPKNGQVMAFLTVIDQDAESKNVSLFPEKYTAFGHLLTEGNLVMLIGSTDGSRMTVNQVVQLERKSF